MARRREPGQKEYSPLDEAKGRLLIDEDLVRDVISERISVREERPGPPAAAVAAVPPPPLEPAGEERAFTRKPITVEKLTKYNKFLTTPKEKLELERLAAHVSGALGVSVKPSQLIRACLIQLLHAEHDILRRASEQPSPKRPSNTEAVALAEFDTLLAEIISKGFRDAGPIKHRV